MDSVKKKALLDALEIAYKRETDAFNFYQKALHKAPYPETRAMLQQLAEEERKHRYFIRQELEKIDTFLQKETEESYIDDQDIRFKIPDRIPFMRLQSVPGVDLAALSLPSELIGGDYLDTIRIKNPNGSLSLGIFLYDVMGHGMDSTQLKASAKTVFGKLREAWGKGEAKVDMSKPAEVMTALNKNLYPKCQECGRFITAFYGVISLEENSLIFTSAGHEPPILIRAVGRYHPIEDTDLLLGADAGVVYSEFAVPIKTGDVVALFSDGMTEAGNPDEGMFTRHSLCQQVLMNKKESSRDIMEKVMSALKNFLRGAPLTDDCSLAVMKITD